jgi:hypothetical protein
MEQAREAEMLQAIDRLRSIHNEKRNTIRIPCSIPRNLPVDELVTWRQLTGDRRLERCSGCVRREGVGCTAAGNQRAMPDVPETVGLVKGRRTPDPEDTPEAK